MRGLHRVGLELARSNEPQPIGGACAWPVTHAGIQPDPTLREHFMTVTGIISAIIIGAIIGALGRLVVPGKQHIPIWLTIVIGIVAAFIGSFIAGALGYANGNGGIPWILLLIQIILAAIGVAIVAGTYGRRGVR
jgi:uncharacterized membrane protein YeaQ/YmgE (transglycosylase-associated protein family)